MASKRKSSTDAPNQHTPNKRRHASRGRPQESSDDEDMPRARGRSRVRRQVRAKTISPFPESMESTALAVEDSSSEDEEQDVVHRGRVRSQGRATVPSHSPSPVEPSAHEGDSTSSEDESAEDNDGETDELIARIRTGIHYTRSQLRKNLPPMQTTRFTIPLPTEIYTPTTAENTALALLRSSPATSILTAPDFEVFELGIPIPYFVPEGAVGQVIHSAHWWVGKSAAEIKAGPHAEKTDIKKATAQLKGLATKKQNKVNKTAKEREIENKLEEGLRRQQAGEKMCDSDSEGYESEDEDLEDLENFESELEDLDEEMPSAGSMARPGAESWETLAESDSDVPLVPKKVRSSPRRR